MPDGRMWFGNEKYFTWVPAFGPGSKSSLSFFTDSIKFANGGGDRVRSSAGQIVYDLDFPVRDASGYSPWGTDNEGLDVFSRFSSGYYGEELHYISDEMIWDVNVLPRAWATPSLIEQGWPSFSPGGVTFAGAFGFTNYDLPLRSCIMAIPANYLNVVPTQKSKYLIVPIPPTHSLSLGATAVSSSNAALRVDYYSDRGVKTESSDLALLTLDSTDRTNLIVTGADAAYVKIYITAKDNNPGFINLNSMIGQIHKSGTSASLYPSNSIWPSGNLFFSDAGSIVVRGNHIEGRGHTGLIFADEALAEEYVMSDRHLKGLATTLEEVGAWR